MADFLDRLGNTWPAKMAVDAYNAFMLPGQVAGGQLATQPSVQGQWSDEDEARQQATQGTMMNRAVDLGGLMMGGSYAAPAMKDATGMGIRAYHGSPHDFDKFDISKIGTGEGAQAYGHGLYFAENKNVAGEYRKLLSGEPGEALFVKSNTGDRKYSIGRADPTYGTPEWRAANELALANGDIDRAISQGVPEEAARVLKNWKDEGAQFRLKKRAEPGRMYEVDINARPEQFLDWDKPLAQQADAVRAPVADLLQRTPPQHPVIGRLDFDPNKSGSQIYSELEHTGASKAGSAELLRGLGIPGIKYLDQGSRGAGEGSRNYVVFDDKLVQIIKKYGIAGAASMLGVSQSDIADAAPAAP